MNLFKLIKHCWPTTRQNRSFKIFRQADFALKADFLLHAYPRYTQEHVYGGYKSDVTKWLDSQPDFDVTKWLNKQKDFDTSKWLNSIPDFDTSKWLDSNSDFDTAKWLNKQKDFSTKAWLNAQPDFDLSAWLNGSSIDSSQWIKSH